MSDLTRRGILGGLLGLPVALTAELPGASPVTEVKPVEPLPDCPPRSHCRICDKAFAKGEQTHVFLDFYVINNPNPLKPKTPLEVKAQMRASGLTEESVPLRDLFFTSGVDRCCTHCRETFVGRKINSADPDDHKKWEASLNMWDRRIWQDYRARMLRTPPPERG